MFKYTVEMFNNQTQQWEVEMRYYDVKKPLDAIDLKDTCGLGKILLRRNAKFIG